MQLIGAHIEAAMLPRDAQENGHRGEAGTQSGLHL